MYEVYLKKGEERRILSGHSWVYANEVQEIKGKDKNGSLATVFTHDKKYIGKGYINHLSKILVRIFIRNDDIDDEEFYKKRIKAANDMRIALGFDDAYRMVFAESDDLPALIIDKYADVLVMECLSLGISQRKDLIVKCLVDLFHPKGIFEKSEAQVLKKEGVLETQGVLYGEVPEKIVISENGVKMYVDVRNGQKTGYFLDQKENRMAIRRYAKDKTVLDCFSNSGGFSINAATVAKEVTAVDISEIQVKAVLENAALNGFKNVNAVCADVFEYLRLKKTGKQKVRRCRAGPARVHEKCGGSRRCVQGIQGHQRSGVETCRKRRVSRHVFLLALHDADAVSENDCRKRKRKRQAGAPCRNQNPVARPPVPSFHGRNAIS